MKSHAYVMQGGSEAAKSPRPFTAPVGSTALSRLATLPHLLSQPSQMPASWNTPPTPNPHVVPAVVQDPAALSAAAAEHEAALQQLRDKQADQQHRIQQLQADVAR